MEKIRLYIQLAFAALTNGYVKGFIDGKIFKGATKAACVPGLNCYSCPGALGSCPVGSLQAVLNNRKFHFSGYIFGFLIFIGALIGRFVCGFLCPFGLVQDLIYKIPLTKKIKNLPGHKYLKYGKYFTLIVFVIILPITVSNALGMGDPWFCKWICPSGTLLGGIPLVSSDPYLQEATGWLFNWKVFLLAVILLTSLKVYRPFCKYLCPLGAAYGIFNPISAYHLKVDQEKCIMCRRCEKVCKMGIKTYETPNSPECIRCLDCVKACPVKAISTSSPIKPPCQMGQGGCSMQRIKRKSSIK